MNIRIWILPLILLMSACGKQESGISSVASGSLRSSMAWSSSTPWWATDLNPSGPNIQIIHWVMAYDQECESAASVNNGTLTVALSTQVSASKPSDTSCSYWDGNWTYSESNGQLTLCQQNEPCVDLKP